ncbi:MAG TPA: ORF6N domain-containing protein [Phycisphaerae bacterium]
MSRSIVRTARIDDAILVIRGHKVLLDADLASLYGVETGALVRAMKRNVDRFPGDFMFQLSKPEFDDLRCQFGISKLMPRMSVSSSHRGGRRHRPYAFTEQGVAMLSSVLRSKRAVRVNIEIMRAFVRLRRVLATDAELARRLDEVEHHIGRHDEQFAAVITAIRKLMAPPRARKRKPIGYLTEAEDRRK